MTQVKFHPSPLKNLLNDLAFQTWNEVVVPAFKTSNLTVNIGESDQNFKVELVAPGFQKSDFQVKVEKNLLTIRAEKENEAVVEGLNWKHKEFTAKTFERTFQLPETVNSEELSAAYESGILTIHLPKVPEVQPIVKTIAVA
jgi:HSP20 family protein